MPLTPSLIALTAKPSDFGKLVADLQGSGLQVRHARDLLEAVLAHIHAPSNVLVCDVEGLNWNEVLEVFGQLEHSIPVIFLTRFADEPLWIQMHHTGAFDTLEKSYQRYQLQWAVVNALGDKYLLLTASA